jgi:hypothetical protein
MNEGPTKADNCENNGSLVLLFVLVVIVVVVVVGGGGEGVHHLRIVEIVAAKRGSFVLRTFSTGVLQIVLDFTKFLSNLLVL